MSQLGPREHTSAVATSEALRRVFVEPRELPGLALGALSAEPAAARRVLGARRAGRIGLLLALLGTLLATAELSAALRLAAANLVAVSLVALAKRRTHRWLDAQRLGCWTALAPLAALGLLRLVFGSSEPLALAAVALNAALAYRALAVTR